MTIKTVIFKMVCTHLDVRDNYVGSTAILEKKNQLKSVGWVNYTKYLCANSNEARQGKTLSYMTL